METSVTVNSASLFPCLDYMDNFRCSSLKRKDKCLINGLKLTKLIR